MTGKHSKAFLSAALMCLGLSACGGGGDSRFPDEPASVVLNVSAASVEVGGAANLTWSTANADSCTASGAFVNPGPRPVNNPAPGESTGTLTVPGTMSYTLTCSGDGGTDSDTKTVTVGLAAQGPTVALSLAPKTIRPGTSATLSWTSVNANACTASEAWSGNRPTQSPASGESTGPIATNGTYRYTLTCFGAGGMVSSDTEVLTVSDAPTTPVPTVSVTVNPATITSGQSSNIIWSSSDATSCVASGDWSGTRPVSGTDSTGTLTTGTYSYTLTCTGPGGTKASTPAVLTVNDGPVVIPGSVNLLVNGADSITVLTGSAPTLTWTSSANVSTCTASAVPVSTTFTGTKPANNTVGESAGTLAAGTYSFTLNCSGANGVTATDSVNVTAQDVLTSSVDLKVNGRNGPVLVPAGNFTQLSWVSTGPGTCVASGAWSGTKSANGMETVFPTGAASSSLTYTLTCGGVPDSVVVNIGPVQPSCGVPQFPDAKAVLDPYASVSTGTPGICVGCSVANPDRVIDSNPLNFARASIPANVLGGVSLTVSDNNNVYPTGSVAGVILSIPGQTVLTLDLVGGLTVEALNNQNVVVGKSFVYNLIDLYLLGRLDDPTLFFQPVTSIAPFSKVRVSKLGIVSTLQDVSIFNVCVAPSVTAPATP